MTKQEEIEVLKKEIEELKARPVARQLKEAKNDIYNLCATVDGLVILTHLPEDVQKIHRDNTKALCDKWGL